MKKYFNYTWLEINLDAIAQNIRNIKRLIGDKKELMAMIPWKYLR